MNKSLLSTRNSGHAHVSTLRRCVTALSAALVFLACFVASLFIIGPHLVGFTPLGGVSFCFLLAFLSFQIAKAFKRYCYKRFCFRKNECGTFRFVHIWQKKDGEWKISRAISYSH